MRAVRTLMVTSATIATLGMAAASANAANVYTVSGSGTTGGTTSKPKAASLKINFTVSSDPAGAAPDVIAKYAISIEGGRVNKAMQKALPQCKTGSTTGSAQSSEQCPSGSIIGKGSLTAVVGAIGDPITAGNTCHLPYNLYNIPGGKLGLFISASQTQCLVPVKQWIPISIKQSGNTVTTSFSVPENLQQPLTGLFSPVTQTSLTLNAVTKKIKGKKQAFTEAIGCKDKKRDVSVKFTTRGGVTTTAKKTVAC